MDFFFFLDSGYRPQFLSSLNYTVSTQVQAMVLRSLLSVVGIEGQAKRGHCVRERTRPPSHSVLSATVLGTPCHHPRPLEAISFHLLFIFS